jgi:UDP-galactopyranose mutase
MYDYVIVGSGMFGSVCAHELTKKGNKCLVLEKRNHIGGNCYTENKDGINIHKYGAHIFHTSNKEIWDYINQFAQFNNYVNRVKVNYKDILYSFPINLFTLHQLYGVTTPEQAKQKLEEVRVKNDNPNNLEEWIISQVGVDIYVKFIKGYTTKQWGRHPMDLPTSIIKRLPIRFNHDDNYYNDTYQGIPIGGYTQIFEKMLNGIEVKLNTDYLANRNEFNKLATKKVIYTGPIDAFYNYAYGQLNYRSLKFETERVEVPDYQGNAVINYTETYIPYTRILEHKHFDYVDTPYTYITKEYPREYGEGMEPYYPINDKVNTPTYDKYKALTESETKYIFGGRLAEYRYYDMHQVLGAALHTCKKL